MTKPWCDLKYNWIDRLEKTHVAQAICKNQIEVMRVVWSAFQGDLRAPLALAISATPYARGFPSIAWSTEGGQQREKEATHLSRVKSPMWSRQTQDEVGAVGETSCMLLKSAGLISMRNIVLCQQPCQSPSEHCFQRLGDERLIWSIHWRTSSFESWVQLGN